MEGIMPFHLCFHLQEDFSMTFSKKFKMLIKRVISLPMFILVFLFAVFVIWLCGESIEEREGYF